MGREELLALADRVEAASGPDRELDFWITTRIEGTRHTDEEIQADIDAVGIEGMYIPHAYTASLDAAMTLVPDGLMWTMDSWSRSQWSAGIWCHSKRWIIYSDVDHQARTPALALTAAALRAMGQEQS